MMLDVAPGINPTPREWEIVEYLENGWDPHPKTIYILVPCVKGNPMVCRSWPLGSTPPLRKLKLLNILKTVEIPTPKPYIFLFLVLRSIQWYVGDDPWDQPHPPGNWNSWISWKPLRSPPQAIYILFSCVKGNPMVCRSWPLGSTPPPRKLTLLNILKTVEIPTPKPYIFLFLVLRSIQWYVGHDPWGQPHPPGNWNCWIS